MENKDLNINYITNNDLGGISSSWLDHHVLNEDSQINGVIINHQHEPKTYGGVAVKTHIGNFAIVKEHQKKAAKNKGASVLVKPHKDYYCTMIIIKYDTLLTNYPPPDEGDVCWKKGKKTFTRKEVAYLLYTQRAMISNDLKTFCGNDMTTEMFDILNKPRQPEW